MTAMLTTTFAMSRYGAGNGLLCTAPATAALTDLDPLVTVRLLRESGFIVFRGFRADLELFSALVHAVSGRITLDPAREFHGGDVAQKVDAGTDAIGLHIENGNSPFAPDLTWFFCEKAAAEGSETTVCDGYRVWDEFSEETRAQFTAQDIAYSRRVEEDRWKAFVRHQLGDAKPADEITVDDMRGLATGPGKTLIEPLDGGAIRYEFQVPAAHATLFGSRLAFANSILGPSYNYEKPRITFADGTEFAAELMRETEERTAALTEDLAWQDGDVALIDNTRVMHGRRRILDPARTIYNAQSYLSDDLRAAV
ncbi:TauD/TfdA family dioxygenase [Micromonospora sp. NPDC049497]|uniref:TauD/TfdA family dioxygenase n=1 Tax=Micromonospora sp. NPDC049497 TaxID=3364273 RepID=UPI003797A767